MVRMFYNFYSKYELDTRKPTFDIPKNIIHYWSDRSISENFKKLSSLQVEFYSDYNCKLYNRESAIYF